MSQNTSEIPNSDAESSYVSEQWGRNELRFQPVRFFPNGHLQTISGAYLWKTVPHRAKDRTVVLPDGDQLVVHDDCPDDWDGRRLVLLVHGLGGAHDSGYMQRISNKLVNAGIRAVRMDQRGCGAGAAIAEGPFHAGRFAEIATVVEFLGSWHPNSKITVAGFSLGGAMTVKMLAEFGSQIEHCVDSAIVVSPPIDLLRCSQNLSQGANRFYDKRFVRSLMNHVRKNPRFACRITEKLPKSLYEFDAMFTAPLGGFSSVDEYYSFASSTHDLPKINIPTILLAAEDDPIVPAKIYDDAPFTDVVRVHRVAGGGHLGFLASKSCRTEHDDRDWHWMDWRVIQWIRQLA